MNFILALLLCSPCCYVPMERDSYRAAAARATKVRTITRDIMTFKNGRYEFYRRTWEMPGYGGGPVIILNPYVK